MILLSRTKAAISFATGSGRSRASPDLIRRAVVRYVDSWEGVHCFGFSGSSSAADVGIDGRVSARFVRVLDGVSNGLDLVGEAENDGGIGRGLGLSDVKLLLYRWPFKLLVGLGLLRLRVALLGLGDVGT